ncbi:MAG: hypothetical protein IKU10_02100, partial [Clostridia bacterium]|nr:hypothetical protein [Clostridia bacterium]
MQPLRIWDRRANTTNCYVDFFKDFTIVNITTPLILKLYADTEYVVYCNGRFVARGQYRCFPNTPVYDTIDLTAYAQAGYNRLAITVYYQGELSYQYAKGDPGLWFTLYQEETCLAVSDSSVLSAPSKTLLPNAHRITRQYGFGFIYNATEETDWRFSNGCLSTRFIHAEERGTLSPSPRPIQKCTIASPTYGTLIQQGNLVRTENGNHPALAVQTDQLFPCEQSERSFPTENPYFIWDLGREMAGF